MSKAKPCAETELYLPVKKLFESQGYEVKGEVGKADLVACRESEESLSEEPIIVELKTGFSLQLMHQGVERQAISDQVYIAVPKGKGKLFQKSLKRNIALCKRLGLGIIIVNLGDKTAEAKLDPAPYKPRKNHKKKARLLKEFSQRVGDPNEGGSHGKLITSYKQDALRCLNSLKKEGASKASDVAKATAVKRARNIMADNHYGWFKKVSRGIYDITSAGDKAVKEFSNQIKALK